MRKANQRLQQKTKTKKVINQTKPNQKETRTKTNQRINSRLNKKAWIIKDKLTQLIKIDNN